MAESSKKPEDKDGKKLVAKKKSMTVREKREAANASTKPKRIRKAAGKVRLPVSKAKKISGKEYHLPLPDNKAGRLLKKRVRFVPKFVREAFAEIKLVTWPTPKETVRLTIAVFIFAVVFASIVGALDYVLGELFKKFFVEGK